MQKKRHDAILSIQLSPTPYANSCGVICGGEGELPEYHGPMLMQFHRIRFVLELLQTENVGLAVGG